MQVSTTENEQTATNEQTRENCQNRTITFKDSYEELTPSSSKRLKSPNRFPEGSQAARTSTGATKNGKQECQCPHRPSRQNQCWEESQRTRRPIKFQDKPRSPSPFSESTRSKKTKGDERTTHSNRTKATRHNCKRRSASPTRNTKYAKRRESLKAEI